MEGEWNSHCTPQELFGVYEDVRKMDYYRKKRNKSVTVDFPCENIRTQQIAALQHSHRSSTRNCNSCKRLEGYRLKHSACRHTPGSATNTPCVNDLLRNSSGSNSPQLLQEMKKQCQPRHSSSDQSHIAAETVLNKQDEKHYLDQVKQWSGCNNRNKSNSQIATEYISVSGKHDAHIELLEFRLANGYERPKDNSCSWDMHMLREYNRSKDACYKRISLLSRRLDQKSDVTGSSSNSAVIEGRYDKKGGDNRDNKRAGNDGMENRWSLKDEFHRFMRSKRAVNKQIIVRNHEEHWQQQSAREHYYNDYLQPRPTQQQ